MTPDRVPGESPAGGCPASYAEVLAYATQNRARLGMFARDSHFPTLHPAETGLFLAVFYVTVDDNGLVQHMVLHKLTRRHTALTAVRVLICGTWDMFMAPRAKRNFAVELQAIATFPWNDVQRTVLTVTQKMLNTRASWFGEGFSTLLLPAARAEDMSAAYMAGMGAGPASVGAIPSSPSASCGSPMSSRTGGGGGGGVDGSGSTASAAFHVAASPPGHFDLSRACDMATGPAMHRVPQEHLASRSDHIAISNLQHLERARVQESAATMFLDSCGNLRHILFGRPSQSSLQFLAGGDEEDHLAVIRIHLSGTRIEMEHPCEPLNRVQKAVVDSMQRILNATIA